MTSTIFQGDVRDVLKALDAESVQCVVTSPPYWGLRDYGVDKQIGLEETPEEYVTTMVEVFREVKRVLRDDGTLWLNLGDSYYSNFGGGSATMSTGNATAIRTMGRRNKPPHELLKPKDLVGIPWRVAFALQADGWYLRSDIIWAKGVSFCRAYSGTIMPESVTDRPTKSHEYLFLLTKSARYYYDAEAVKEPAQDWGSRDRTNWRGKINSPAGPQTGCTNSNFAESGRNLRSVWTINTKPYREAHFATFPEKLVEPCVKAGTKKGDTVLDPFAGSGTTGLVAGKLDRKFIGIELNEEYIRIANNRIEGPLFADPRFQ